MTTAELFKAFGGRKAVMAVTGQSRDAVNHWHKAGVPYRHWPALTGAAVAGGIPGITNEALRSTRPKEKVRSKARQGPAQERQVAA